MFGEIDHDIISVAISPCCCMKGSFQLLVKVCLLVLVTSLLSFRHLSESLFLLGALHRRSEFANFYPDIMPNHLS